MSLPENSPSDDLVALGVDIEGMNLEEMDKLANPESKDYELVGIIIQLFCYIDLNLRRIYESLKYIDDKRSAFSKDEQILKATGKRSISINQIISYIESFHCNAYDLQVRLSSIKGIISAIQLVRPYRNAFAHLALKLDNSREYFILFSKNDIDSISTLGAPALQFGLFFGLCRREDIKNGLISLDEMHIALAKEVVLLQDLHPKM